MAPSQSGAMGEFVVARNPDRESRLPYLLYLPLDDGLWLKAKDAWPRAARVYCHQADPPDLGALDVVERVPVASCVRRGPAIDLVLVRGVNRRSQFVFTSFRGRSMILWQTPKAAAAARPGARVPSARAERMESIVVDTRERYGYRFAAHGVAVARRALPAGDYAAQIGERVVAVVERKTLEDFTKSLNDGSLNFAMAELAVLPAAAVVVEGTYSALLRHEYSRAGFMADLVARLAVRYSTVPIVFVESRKFAEEWTFRFLRAARAHAQTPELIGPAEPRLAVVAPPPAPAPAKKKRGRPLKPRPAAE